MRLIHIVRDGLERSVMHGKYAMKTVTTYKPDGTWVREVSFYCPHCSDIKRRLV